MNTESDVVNSKEFRLPRSSFWAGSQLIRWRWWLFAIFFLGIVAFELFIAPLVFNNPVSFEFEQLVLFFIVLLAALSLAEILLQAVVAKSRAVELLEIKHDLSVQLALASDRNDLVDSIMAFCEALIDLDRVVLLVRNPKSGIFEAVAQSQTQKYANVDEEADAVSDMYCTCAGDATVNLHPFKLSPDTVENVALHGYCLPLVLGDRAIAKLNLYLPAGYSLSDEQTNIFNNIASDMAIAVVTEQQRQAQANLLIAQARSVQRRRISRDLHDTLGQKLVYLRFKLDQFANSDEKTRLGDICNDLEQMRTVANESYELVRGTLAVLNTDETPSLLKLLIGHSRLVVDRSNLKFTFDETGPPQMLPSETLGQIFYIFGEALSNVEKHAAAQKVDVKLNWDETELVIKVADNGRGFDAAVTQEEGHYGLAFMRERAETLGGHINFHSTPGRGTRLTIRIPISENKGNQPVRSVVDTNPVQTQAERYVP